MATTEALLLSLIHGPRLIGDLPEASIFACDGLPMPATFSPLNLRQKLGHLYEEALAMLLEAAPGFRVLARNLQLREGGHPTLGEIDFLIRDLGTGQLIHLELATKFYLGVETEAGLTLPGPDARDHYFRKIGHLRGHQLQLTCQHQALLPEAFRHETIIPRQLVYGCLFDHLHADQPAAPEFINSHCRRGRWLSIDECAGHFSPDSHFQIIPKSLWPVPLEFLNEIPLESWAPSSSHDRCLMLRVNHDPVPYIIAPSGYPVAAAAPRPPTRSV